MAALPNEIPPEEPLADEPRPEAREKPEPAFWPLFGFLLVVGGVLPVWIGRYLPMVDLPAHLAVARIYHDLRHLPGTPFARFFGLRPGFTPYLAFYWLTDLLSPVMSMETSAKIFVTLCTVGLPLSMVPLLRAFRRTRWLALAAIPLPWSKVFFLGFLNYMAALPVTFLAIAVLAGCLDGKLRGRRWDAALFAMPFAVLVCHGHAWLFYLCAAALMIPFGREGRVKAALSLLPSIAPFVIWAVAVRGPAHADWQVWWDPLSEKLRGFGGNLTEGFQDDLDYRILWFFVLAWVWFLLNQGRRPAIAAKGLREWGWEAMPLLLALGALAGYLVCPRIVIHGEGGHMYVYHRFAPLVAAFALAIPPVRAGSTDRPAIGVLAALVIFNGVYLCERMRDFNREAGSFADLAAAMEPDACVANLSPDAVHSQVAGGDQFTHFYQLFTLWRGAVPGFPFSGGLQLPVVNLDEPHFPRIWPQSQPELVAQGRLFEAYGGFYRYFLVPRSQPIESLFGADAHRLEKVGEGGPFALWKNPAGTCGRQGTRPQSSAPAVTSSAQK